MGLFAILFFSAVMSAHPLDIAYFQIEKAGGNISVTLDVHPTVISDLIQKDVAQIQNDVTSATMSALSERVFGANAFRSNELPCEFVPTSLKVNEINSLLSGKVTCPDVPLQLQIKLDFFVGVLKTYKVFGRSVVDGVEGIFTLDENSTAHELTAAPQRNLFTFIQLGLEHIAAWPSEWYDEGAWKIPDGIDHVIFLLGLLLAARTFRQTVWTITGFTIGHSFTLCLALLNIIHVPSNYVEPAIALTIALIGAEIIWLKPSAKLALSVAGFFGLVHGLGFAGSLGSLNVSSPVQVAIALFGFNFGIEVGQLAFALVLVPSLWWARRWAWFSRYAVPGMGVFIFSTGIYWFLTRL